MVGVERIQDRNMAASMVRKAMSFLALIFQPHRPERKLLLVLALAAFALWMFVEVAEEMLEGDTRVIDERLLMVFRNAADPALPLGPAWVREVMRDITALGSTFVLLLVTLASIGFLALTKNRHAALLVLIAVLGGMLLSTLLKAGFDRARPDLVLHTMTVYSASFPSGHAMMSAVVYLTLGALLAATQQSTRLKLYILGLGVFLTLIVGVSRVYLGVHWPTDVLAGWALGASWAMACWSVMVWLQRRGDVEPPAPEPREHLDPTRSV
jgi:undecaprenyl-diphosphatase